MSAQAMPSLQMCSLEPVSPLQELVLNTHPTQLYSLQPRRSMPLAPIGEPYVVRAASAQAQVPCDLQ